jgi:hypothetical protein
MTDLVNHPPHYGSHPSGVECITVTEHYNFNVGNAIKYLWRAGLKDGVDPVEDLKKAAWYVNREIHRLTSTGAPTRAGAPSVANTGNTTTTGPSISGPFSTSHS